MHGQVTEFSTKYTTPVTLFDKNTMHNVTYNNIQTLEPIL